MERRSAAKRSCCSQPPARAKPNFCCSTWRKYAGSRLQDRRLVQQRALRETGWTQNLDLAHNTGFAVQDQVGNDLARCGRVHDAMSAETVGTEEALNVGLPDDGMMIGRHLVKARPCAFRIDREVFEAGNAVGCAHQKFLDG